RHGVLQPAGSASGRAQLCGHVAQERRRRSAGRAHETQERPQQATTSCTWHVEPHLQESAAMAPTCVATTVLANDADTAAGQFCRRFGASLLSDLAEQQKAGVAAPWLPCWTPAVVHRSNSVAHCYVSSVNIYQFLR
ncbi:MAG: hypothetical protein MHM6MM_001856, partial [Cercozoa sp. M6MM]